MQPNDRNNRMGKQLRLPSVPTSVNRSHHGASDEGIAQHELLQSGMACVNVWDDDKHGSEGWNAVVKS